MKGLHDTKCGRLLNFTLLEASPKGHQKFGGIPCQAVPPKEDAPRQKGCASWMGEPADGGQNGLDLVDLSGIVLGWQGEDTNCSVVRKSSWTSRTCRRQSDRGGEGIRSGRCIITTYRSHH